MTETEVAQLIAEFAACRLPKARWTHQAHLVVGFWHASKYPAEQALTLIRARIKAHNESVGTANTDSSGYHETITCLYMRAIAAHLAAHKSLEFADSLQLMLDSPMGEVGWPLRHYTKERLFSVVARRQWIEPDLAGLIHQPD